MGRPLDRLRPLIVLTAVLTLVFAACGEGAEEATLDDLQLVGVDFELNAIILTNNASEEVRTEGLWMYQDGESSEFNVFIIEPRTTILFSVRDIGGADVSGGEIALYRSDSFADPDAMLDYVAWGVSGHSRRAIATNAGLWSGPEAVDTTADSVVMVRVDPAGNGPLTWEVSSEIP